MKKFVITDIQYDADGEDVEDLPTEIVVEVPKKIKDSQLQEFLSEEISNRTGFCHFGFVVTPENNS